MANTYKALQTVTVGAGGVASVTFSNIPQTYTDLVIKTSYRSNRNAAADTLRITFSNGTTYNQKIVYSNGSGVANGTGSSSSGIEGLWGSDNSNTSLTFGNSEMYIPEYVGSGVKISNDMSVTENNATLAYAALTAGISDSTARITSVTLVSNTASTILQYSTFTLYGVFNADVSTAPATPTIGTATAGNAEASITFTGVSNAASYTMTSTPGSITAIGASSPITVSGLTNGTAYTFKVKSNNPFGSSAESAASNSVTPINSAFESIATINGTGSAAYVEFTGIPATYTHLQIRGIVQPNNPGGGGFTWPVFRLNGDASNAYSHHYIQGNGSGVSGNGGGGNQTYGLITLSTQGNATNVFSGFTMDILDYRNSSKFKTVRTLGGFDNNGTGQATLSSCLWRDLSAISSIRIYANDGLTLNVSANATFALYGIKVS
jgi:hypothetical protein